MWFTERDRKHGALFCLFFSPGDNHLQFQDCSKNYQRFFSFVCLLFTSNLGLMLFD